MNKLSLIIIATVVLAGLGWGFYVYRADPKTVTGPIDYYPIFPKHPLLEDKSPTEVYKLFKAEADAAVNFDQAVEAFAKFVPPDKAQEALADLDKLSVADKDNAYEDFRTLVPPLSSIKDIQEKVDGDEALLTLTANDEQSGYASFVRQNGVWYLTAEKFGL